jgi:carbon monoxide dehydrogenase subunit G
MEFDNSFEVMLPPARAWALLMDIERIAPCVPGAQLTERVDDQAYKGKVSVRLGPVSLTFAGVARFEEIDNTAHTARVKASGSDAKGRGGANSTVQFYLEPIPGGSKVLVHTNLTLSGAVAQYGRGVGMIQDVAGQIIKQFAINLGEQLVEDAEPEPEPAAASTAPPAKPISGLSLLFHAFLASLRRLLFGARKSDAP